MDPRFVNAAMKGDFNMIFNFISNHSADELLKLCVPNSGNTILHLASEYGHTDAVKEILSKQSLLLFEINSDGDTPLHLAAKGGHTEVVHALISCVQELDTDILRLHILLNTGRAETNPLRSLRLLPKRIMSIYIGRWQDILSLKNKEGNTVVHEAIRYNCIEVVSVLLKEDPGFKHSHNALGETPLYIAASRGFHHLVDLVINASQSPICDGPKKRTALHGAVICNSQECTVKLLRWDKSLQYRKDEYFLIPLHYAAQLGFVNLLRELLNVDASVAYITSTREKRNVLHIAIEHKQEDVIEYLLKEWPLLVNSLITKKDNEGNTPLHLLATSNLIVRELIHHPMADKGDLNNTRSTPLDMVIHHNDGNSSTSAAKNQVMAELKSAGVIRFQIAPSKPIDNEKIRKMVDNHIIVAALIATVAFTAGFAMPGGYIQSGSSNQGMAVLSRNSVAFQAFVISDVVALICSTGALFMYFFSVISKGKSLRAFAVIGYFLNLFGLGAMIVAFIAGTYAVLQYSHALAVATSVVASCISFIVMTLFDLVAYDIL